MNEPQQTTNQAAEMRKLNDALEAAGIFVAVEIRDGALIISGEVDSAEMREAALDIAGAVASTLGVKVEDAIDVIEIRFAGDADAVGVSGAGVTAAFDSTDTDVGTIDADRAGEEAIPYFPPTDPVIGEQYIEQDEVEIIGGFQTTSLQGDEDEAANQPFRGDERITEDVRRELREDASTTDLSIHVHTRNGVVFLVGDVETMEDAENAEAVAGRVPGVVEVREELKVRALRQDRER